MKKIFLGFLCVLFLLGVLCGCAAETAGKQYRIGLITMDLEESLEAGMARAAGELEAELLKFTDEAGAALSPSDQVWKAAAQNCEALIVAGMDADGLSEDLLEVVEAGIKLVCVDTALDMDAAAVFSADHHAAGKAAGEAMLAALEAKRITAGSVAILGVGEEDQAAMAREAGFREAFAGSSHTLLETRFVGTNATMARSAAWQMLTGGVSGLYGCGPDAAVGAGQAARDADNGAVVMGTGQSEEIAALMEVGFIRRTVTEDTQTMGYEAVKAAVAALKGEEIRPLEDPPLTVLESKAPLLRIQDYTIALVAEDRISSEGWGLEAGALKAAKELGCEVENLSPLFFNEEQQIAKIEQALLDGYFAIVASAADSEAVSAALKNAADAGMTVVCAGGTAHSSADACLTVDYRAEGRQAARTMLRELESREIFEGNIGIIQVAEDAPETLREEGFREVLEGTPYTLLQTQYSGGDAAQSHGIAEACFRQNAVAIFCCSEGSTVGAGSAAKLRRSTALVLGCGSSDAISALIEEGWLLASAASDADALGYEAVKAACTILSGKDPAEAEMTPGVTIRMTDKPEQ